MNHLLSILLAATLCATASAQTIKTLGFNTTTGQVVANTGTNVLTFPTIINAEELANSGDVAIQLANRELIAGGQSVFIWDSNYVEFGQPITFAGTNAAPASRANLGFSTNLNTLWTATNASNARSAVGLGATWLTNGNVTNFRSAIGLGATNTATFARIDLVNNTTNSMLWLSDGGTIEGNGDLFIKAGSIIFASSIEFGGASPEDFKNQTRTNLNLGLPALTNTSNVTTMRALSGSTNTNHPYSGSISVTGTNNTNTLVFSNGILQTVQ